MARPKKTQLPKSPVTQDTKGEKFGGALVSPPRRGWEVATIVDYSPSTQSYTVRATFGVVDGVPRLLRDSGEVSILPRDAIVVVHDELGFYVIDSVLKLAPSNPTEFKVSQVTEVRGVGGEDPVYKVSDDAPNFKAPGDPTDVLHGDWVRTSPDGNLMGVLAGGTNVMRSSPMSQVRTHALEDMVEIISHKFRHLTAMGNLEVKNDGGKTSLVWRAGSDEGTETGPNTGNWTLRMDAGAAGDMFNFEVTTPKGQTLARVHMSADGRLSMVGAAGVDITSGDRGDAVETIGANKVLDVRQKMSITVKEQMTEDFRAARSTTVSKNDSLVVGNDLSENVNHDRNVYVGGKQVNKIQGGMPVPPPTPGNVALKWEVINGGVETVTGNPVAGALPIAQQSQNFINYAPLGSFNFAIQPTAAGGQFNVVSLLPASVQLGANGVAVPNPTTGGHQVVAIAPFGVMKFEPFLAMMTALLTWLDSHVHLTVVGPSTPPTVPSSPIVTPLIPLIRSIRVSVGL